MKKDEMPLSMVILVIGGLVLFLLLLIMLSFNVFADENVTYVGNVSLVAPDFVELNYSNPNGSVFVFSLECLLPDNMSYVNYSNSSRCEIDRTLNNGETYVRNDQFCDLDISCPSCDCEEWDNVSYQIGWRWYTEGSTINVVYLNENESRSYPYGDSFDFEDEWSIECPRFESCDDPFSRWNPVNISEDEWYWLCLEPFGRYGESLTELNNFWYNNTQQLIQERGAIGESNLNLASENARLEEQLDGFFECKDKRNELENVVSALNKQNAELLEKNSRLEGGSSAYKILFFILLGIFGLFGGSFGLYKFLIPGDRTISEKRGLFR